MALLTLGLLTYLPYHVIKHDSGVEYQRLASEVDIMKAGNKALERENDRLRARIEAFRTDPRLLERRARERLLVARDEDVILVFPAEDRPVVPEPPPRQAKPSADNTPKDGQ